MSGEAAAPPVRRVRRDDWPEGREVVLVGTAHISPDSVRLVRETIEREEPDGVCVELDRGRFEALMDPARIERLDLKQAVRERKLLPLIAGVALGAWQARMGLRFGVEPGAELREAAVAAREAGIPVHLVDREVRVTLLRVWRRAGFRQKMRLLAGGLESGGGAEAALETEEDLKRLVSADVVSRLVEELGEAFPTLKTVVMDERDAWIADAVRGTEGGRLVVVVGAGHLDGVERRLLEGGAVDREALAEVPPRGRLARGVGVAVPLVILSALGWTWATRGAAAASEGALFWVAVNSIPAAAGAAAALAHPLTVLAALVSAPFTSLTPVLGAGYVTGFVQAWVRPPRVFELRALREEALTPRKWFTNRALRIVLAFLLPTIGSAVGTFVGGSRLIGGGAGVRATWQPVEKAPRPSLLDGRGGGPRPVPGRGALPTGRRRRSLRDSPRRISRGGGHPLPAPLPGRRSAPTGAPRTFSTGCQGRVQRSRCQRLR